MFEMTVDGSWAAVARDCRAFDDSRHDFDDEFGDVAAGSANCGRVVGIGDAIVRVLRDVHECDTVTSLVARRATVCADDAALKSL